MVGLWTYGEGRRKVMHSFTGIEVWRKTGRENESKIFGLSRWMILVMGRGRDKFVVKVHGKHVEVQLCKY